MSRRRAFGSVRKLPSGRWQARYSDANGNRRVADETYATEGEAEDALTLIQADIIRGTWRDPEAGLITFREWSEKWMAGAHHLRPRTRKKYESILRRRLVPVFGSMPLASIQPEHVWDFVGALIDAGFEPSTIDTEYSLFRTIAGAAVPDRIPVTPCRGVHLPDVIKKAKRRVSIDELARLVDAIPRRYQAMIWVTGIMGLRWSEVAGLTVGRITFMGAPTITVDQALEDVNGHVTMGRTKNRSSVRVLPLPPALRDVLTHHLNVQGLDATGPDRLVFTRPRGGPLDYSDFHHDVWAPAVKAAGLEGLKFHGLRHSSAGLLRQLGVHTQLIARWLGHADDRMAAVYDWVPDPVAIAAIGALDEAIRTALVAGANAVGAEWA